MKPCVLRPSHLWQRLLLCLLSLVFLGSAVPLSAAQGGRKLLKMELSTDRRTAEVQVPAGFGLVTLQRFYREIGWQKVDLENGEARVVKFKLPAAGKEIRWRAIGRLTVKSVAHGNFPRLFIRAGMHSVR